MTGAALAPAERTWEIEPGRGIGPLRIGMPVSAAASALELAGMGPAERTVKGGAPVCTSSDLAVLLHISSPESGERPESVREIEINGLDPMPVQATLSGRNLLGESLSDVQAFLLSVDPRTERRGQLVEAPGLGVRVWSGGDPPRWPVGSVTVTRPTPPALVIAPTVAFATVSHIVQSLGFTGGATTVRPPLVAGEPEVAEWSRRQVLLRYTFDPVSFLRVIRLDGAEASETPVVQRLKASLPMLTEAQVLRDLASDDDEAVLRAIQAVSVLRMSAALGLLQQLSQDGRDLLQKAAVSALIGLPDPP